MKYTKTAMLATLALAGSVMAQDLKVGDKAPGLSVDEWIKGSEVEGFQKGKVYVVEFWATWCGPCIASIPHLAEIQTSHADDGVTVIGVAGFERKGRDNLVNFVTESENGDAMEYTVAYDEDKSMAKSWMDAAGKNGIPTSFLIDQEGKIAYIGHPSQLDKPLKKVLAKGGKYAEKAEKAKKLEVGSKAPKLAIETWVKGEPITGFEKGRVYVVEFWATWCGPCIAGMPHVSKLQKEYADKGVKIIGVNIWDDPKNVEPFMKDRGDDKSGNDLMGYTVAIEKKDDPKDARNGVMAKTWMKAAGQNGIPTAFIVDQKGKIAWIGHPMRMDEPLEKIVAGEWEPTKEAADEAEEQAAMAKAGQMFQEFNELLEDGEYRKAYAIGRKLMEGPLADNAQALNAIAWVIVDPENTPKKQDLELALKAAKRANDLNDGEEPATLDTLAKVYFDMGNLKKALKVQREAVKYSEGTQFEDELTERLGWYEKEAKKRGG
jgi:thiol-disulfide isomerase/thioredoxin